jgi:hypothetical protein
LSQRRQRQHFLGRSEFELLLISIVFQIVSLFTLLRVATGVASFNGQTTNSSSGLALPSSISSNVSIPSTTVQFAAPANGSLSASLVLALVFVAANVAMIGFLAYLYRKKKMKGFSLVISLFLVFVVTELYFTFLSGLASWVPLLVSVIALVVTLFAAFRGKLIVVNALALTVALELGSSFPVLLQAPLNWIIPAVYAVFDIYAVYYGKLGKLVKEVAQGEVKNPPSAPPAITRGSTTNGGNMGTSENKKAKEKRASGLSSWPDFGLLSVRLSEIEIGMADIAFYTMLPTIAALLVARYSLVAFFVVMAAVDLGIIASFAVFRKREVSPGLPVPILMGLATLFVISFVI